MAKRYSILIKPTDSPKWITLVDHSLAPKGEAMGAWRVFRAMLPRRDEYRLVDSDGIVLDYLLPAEALKAPIATDAEKQTRHHLGNLAVAAARYAHNRSTGAPLAVTEAIMHIWPHLTKRTREQIVEESNEATACPEDWAALREFATKNGAPK